MSMLPAMHAGHLDRGWVSDYLSPIYSLVLVNQLAV